MADYASTSSLQLLQGLSEADSWSWWTNTHGALGIYARSFKGTAKEDRKRKGQHDEPFAITLSFESFYGWTRKPLKRCSGLFARRRPLIKNLHNRHKIASPNNERRVKLYLIPIDGGQHLKILPKLFSSKSRLHVNDKLVSTHPYIINDRAIFVWEVNQHCREIYVSLRRS